VTRRPTAAADDHGMTSMELVVAMGISVVVGAIVTSGVVGLFGLTSRAESASVAQSQIHAALGRIDRQVRYAVGISVTDPTGVTYEVVGGNGVHRCYDTRVSAGKLWQRSKVVTGSYGPWTVLASQVTSVAFGYVPPTDANDYQRLRVRLQVTASGKHAAISDTDVTFTAVNTTRASGGPQC
jgi:hypothetical protein